METYAHGNGHLGTKSAKLHRFYQGVRECRHSIFKCLITFRLARYYAGKIDYSSYFAPGFPDSYT
jgi:hypothetical protein